MSWTSPMTAIPGTMFTAADWNLFIRDNLNETETAKATTSGRHFMTTGPHAIAQRSNSQAFTQTLPNPQDTDSNAYTDLPTSGPTVTIATGDKALIMFACAFSNNTTGQYCIVSFGVTGASSIEPIDGRAVMMQDEGFNFLEAGSATILAVTPGTNSFTMKYRVTGGTGTFNNRRLIVLAL